MMREDPKVTARGRAGGNPAFKSGRLEGIAEESLEPLDHVGGGERRERWVLHAGSYGKHLLPNPQSLES